MNIFINPRVSQRAAPDHHGVAAADLHQFQRVAAVGHIPVSDDGNFNGLFHFTNRFPIGAAAVALHARASVYRDRGKSFLLGNFCDGDSLGAGVVRKSFTHFDRHRNIFDAPHDRFKNLPGIFGFAQKRRPAAGGNDLGHRTAEINIEKIKAHVFNHSRGFTHDFRFTAYKLCAQGAVAFHGFKQVVSLVGFAYQGLG